MKEIFTQKQNVQRWGGNKIKEKSKKSRFFIHIIPLCTRYSKFTICWYVQIIHKMYIRVNKHLRVFV